MSTTASSVPVGGFDLSTRPAPRFGGLNRTILFIELRRVLRNKRTVIFTLIFPVVMFLFISSTIPAGEESMGTNVLANVGAYIMVSMAVYGAVMATTAAGASVSIERAAGWSRQLRLTPLSPTAYILLKALMALIVGVLATLVTFAVAALTHKAHIPDATVWLQCGLIIIGGALVFAAFGLFMGYLLPAENAMQFLGPILALLSIFGGIFTGPLSTDSTFGKIAQFTPIYGLGQIAHWPLTLTTSGGHDAFKMAWVVNLLVWALVFVAGATWRFRKDTARV